jgi:hypothetical protein
MKKHGGMEVLRHQSLPRCQMEVSGQFHTSAAEKYPPVSIGYEGGWASGPVWTLWNTEKSPVATGSRTLAVQPLAPRYTS